MKKNKEQLNIDELDGREFKQKLKSLSNKFANEKKKSIKRALDRLMDVTMEKHKVANRTPNPTPNITDLGSIVFLHYQAYVNLKDINLMN